MENIKEKCNDCRQYTGYVQVVATVLLTVLKLVVGILGNSKGLLADALHSAINIFTSLSIFVSKKFGDKGPTENHPYGHGKIEFICSALVSVILLVGTLTLILHSLESIIYNHPMKLPDYSVILVAVISILTNELVFKYFQCVGKIFNSSSILTNSWAIRSDSFSSLAVIIGVLLSRMGFRHADGYVVLVVAAMIVIICTKLLIESVTCLMDKSVPSNTIHPLRKSLRDLRGFELINIRARFNGRSIWVNIDIKMNKYATTEDYDKIVKNIKEKIMKTNNDVEKVFVEYQI